MSSAILRQVAWAVQKSYQSKPIKPHSFTAIYHLKSMHWSVSWINPTSLQAAFSHGINHSNRKQQKTQKEIQQSYCLTQLRTLSGSMSTCQATSVNWSMTATEVSNHCLTGLDPLSTGGIHAWDSTWSKVHGSAIGPKQDPHFPKRTRCQTVF